MPPIFLTSRDAFAHQFAVTRGKWSSHNITRILRLTGERPERVAEMRRILGELGMDHHSWVNAVGVFDHGELWCRWGIPMMLVGHPYQITSEERALLASLSRFGGLWVAIDDRPSYYGLGTHHVRIDLMETQRPWKPFPSTPKTQAAARAARKAFAEIMEEGTS